MDLIEFSGALGALISERRYQDEKWPRGTGCNRSIGEEILCMQCEIDKARLAWNAGSDFKPADRYKMLDAIRKVAAVAVRCMENHGAPLRGAELLASADEASQYPGDAIVEDHAGYHFRIPHKGGK